MGSRLLGRVLFILARREQAQRATELMEGALERHPERAELYPIAFGFYGHVMPNETRRRELIEAWIERLPGDPEPCATGSASRCRTAIQGSRLLMVAGLFYRPKGLLIAHPELERQDIIRHNTPAFGHDRQDAYTSNDC